MRLTEEQRRTIVEETVRIFGPQARVRLFGSRVDDTARGGDIDLHIEAGGTPAELLDRELRLRARLMRRLGERRIDVVVHDRRRPRRPIDQQALSTRVRL
ncbi:MAG: nucleotidyltransferase domain-containing protein [Gammaproteobacteria bacterium]|nr:nucleotidyltransferase domain-containing protein [Gammaproteobacteria bacterium]